jgi:hypothetical protein
MKGTLVVRAAVLAALLGTVCSASPIFWPGSGHWYEFTSQPLDWLSAQSEATSKGGYLVVINDAAEQNFISTTFAPSGANEFFVWIGLWDPSGSGTFQWVNGDPLIYTNWAPGEPNNLGGSEWAGELRTIDFGGQWNDLNGSFAHYGVIEYDTYIPEPATLLFVGSGLIGLSLIRRRLVRS